MKWWEAATPVALVAALLYIDGQVVVAFLGAGIFTLASAFVAFVFALQLAKTGAIFALRSLRMAGGAIILDIYCAELLLLPALLVVYLFFHVEGVQALAYQMIEGWLPGVAFGALPLLAYRLGAAMLRGARLVDVIPMGFASAELGILLSNGAASAAQAQSGLRGVLDFALRGTGGFSAPDPGTFIASATVYVALLLYGLTGRDTVPPVDLRKALALGAGATLLAAAWVVVFSYASLAMDIIFIPPTLGAAAVTWWIARGK